MIIELSMDEAKALHELIDAAVRAKGIDAAAAASHFANKIEQAARVEMEAQARAQEEARERATKPAPPEDSAYKGIPAAEPEILPPAEPVKSKKAA